MKTNDKKGYDKIYNSIGLVPNLGVGSKAKQTRLLNLQSQMVY